MRSCLRCGNQYGPGVLLCQLDGQPVYEIDLTLLPQPQAGSGRRTMEIELQEPVKAGTAQLQTLPPQAKPLLLGGMVLVGGLLLWKVVQPSPPAQPVSEASSAPNLPAQTVAPPVETAAAPSAPPAAETEIQRVIQRWQTIKQQAYLNKDTSELGAVLTEPALSIRKEGVEYWQESSARVYHSLELRALDFKGIERQSEDAALVTVHVVESHGTSEGDKEVDGVFLYSMKKLGDQWYISDIRQAE